MIIYFNIIMITTVISGLFGCITAYGLYCDYENRLLFNNQFMRTKKINDKMLIVGTLTNEFYNESEHDNYKSVDLLPYPIFVYDNPIYKIDSHIKNKIKFHDYDLPSKNFNKNSRFRFRPRHNVRIVEHWITNNLFDFISPILKIDGTPMVMKNNCKIHYTKIKSHYIDNDKYIIEKYIPNNSQVAILTNKKNDTFNVESIGTINDVVNDVALKYYGICDGYTAGLCIGLCVSVICFVGSLVKN
ncbi:hypothetical protein QJ857_gp0793 [Tupanvirus soda lake]|uniref:Uncharacterized protein n=2 Tax=Tupanvirus TaxID=2094720 RepID=A0A6N1NUR5_9VIRU|nr:hypothetical protein QJ857_gp0793 [Tupanvirus soda lake]QKU35256.1 hypothetical protein [Tupanvirus soda lake]